MQQNRFQVAGYLAAKPEIRLLPSGTKVASARLGESYRVKSKDRKVETHTNWHRLTFYNELADLAVSFEQGDNIYAEGSVQQRQFTPTDGSKRTISELVVRSCHQIAQLRNGHSADLVDSVQAPGEGGDSIALLDQNWPL